MRYLPIAMLSYLIASIHWPSQAFSADSNNQAAIKGAALLTCGEFVELMREGNDRQLLVAGWLDGYISGRNITTEGIYDLLPWQRMDVFLTLIADNCTTTPDRRWFDQVNNLVRAMSPTALREKSELTSIDAGNGQKLEIYQGVLRMAQERLIAMGHLSGGADGRYGPKTAAAIAAFQQESGLQINSLPDQPTLLGLFRGLYEQN